MIKTKTKKQYHNKRNGLSFENKLKEKLEGLGFTVVRSAASKSLIDLVCLGEGSLTLFQCKSTKLDKLPVKITPKHKEFSQFGKLNITGVKIVAYYSHKTKLVRNF